jgi:hypothetical protein
LDGQVKPAATRLKELPAEVRLQVMQILKDHSYKAAEPLVESLVGFFCSTDVLCRFRKWHEAMEAMELGQDRVRQITEFLLEKMPDVPTEKVNELAGTFYALMSLGQSDAKMFVNVSRAEAQVERERIRQKRLDLEERRFQESLRKKLDLGIEALGKLFRQSPEAWQHFERARAAIEASAGRKISNVE